MPLTSCLPPVAVVLVICPILNSVIQSYGFDPVWLGILMIIHMEMALINPPFGFNLFVEARIAPEIPLQKIMIDSYPLRFVY